MNLNKVFLIGRLVDEPEIRMTPSGQNVASFRIATNRIWTDPQSGKKEKTEYHNIVAWRRLGEIAGQYLKKGSMVFIEGRMETRSWVDKNNFKHFRTEIIAENMQLGPKPMGPSGNSEFNKNNKQEDMEAPIEELPTVDISEEQDDIKPEDIPF